jgi:hypothetical protein
MPLIFFFFQFTAHLDTSTGGSRLQYSTIITMAATKNNWSQSEAKKLLEKDLLAGIVPLNSSEMPPRVVYGLHAEFLEFPYNNFCQNLLNLRKRFSQERVRAAFDSAALA